MSLPQIRAATVAAGVVDQPSGACPLLNAAMFASTVPIAVENTSWAAPRRFATSNPRRASTAPPPSDANVPWLNNLSADAQNVSFDGLFAAGDPHAKPTVPASTAATTPLANPRTRAECTLQRRTASTVARNELLGAERQF